MLARYMLLPYVCPSVCPSIRHTSEFYQTGETQD